MAIIKGFIENLKKISYKMTYEWFSTVELRQAALSSYVCELSARCHG